MPPSLTAKLDTSLKTDATWALLKRRMLHLIHREQRELETVGLPDAAANAARGRIDAMRRLIAEVEPEKLLTADQIDDGRDYLQD